MTKYIITSEEIATHSGTEKVHFLNPKAKRRNKSLGDLTGLSSIGFHIVEIDPGFESTEFHLHYHEEECVYILSGTAIAIIGEETVAVKAGDFIGYRKAGKAHKLINNGDNLLRCIVVGQRLEHDVADYPSLGKRLYRQKDLNWNLVDMQNISNPTVNQKK